jgi:hypothetical protein
MDVNKRMSISINTNRLLTKKAFKCGEAPAEAQKMILLQLKYSFTKLKGKELKSL